MPAIKEFEQTTPTTTTARGGRETEGLGRTTIADAVVAKVIGLAVREIPGIHAIGDPGIGGTLAGLTARVLGSDSRGSGVGVEVGQREVACDIKVVVRYGVNIPQVAEAARRNAASRLQAITGLTLKEMNIEAADLFFPEDERARAQTSRVE